MTAAYDPELIDRLVREAREANDAFNSKQTERREPALVWCEANVHNLADQLEAARREIDRLNAQPVRLFDKLCADRMADEIAVLVQRKVISSRCPAADALLDYRDPPQSPRSDRLLELETAIDAYRAAKGKT